MGIIIKSIVKSISVIRGVIKRVLTAIMSSNIKMTETTHTPVKVYSTAMQIQTNSKNRWERALQSSIVINQKSSFRKLVAVVKGVVVLEVFFFNILQMLL